jgi:type VI protein secretion system component VasK
MTRKGTSLAKKAETATLYLAVSALVFSSVYFLYAVDGYDMDMPGAVILFWLMVALFVLAVAACLLMLVLDWRAKQKARRRAEQNAAMQASRPPYIWPHNPHRPSDTP